MRLHRHIAFAAVIACLVASAPAAAQSDPQSPDVRDRADQISAGAHYSAQSPDVRDRADQIRAALARTSTPVPPTTTVVSDDGFEWTSALVGSGVTLLVVLLAGGGFALRRRSGSGALHGTPVAH